MELRSQKLREIAPELDPLAWEPDGNRKICQNHRFLWRVPSATVTREADTFWSWWKRPGRESRKPADTAQDISAPISATGKPKHAI